MARPKKTTGPHIYWRNGRAYADLRSYADVGGRREALAPRGSTWGTTDEEIAQALFETRLSQLAALRRDQAGMPAQKTTTLAELARHHLLMKARAGQTSKSHMYDLESRLRAAVEYFGTDRDPRSILPAEVREWGESLAAGGRRKPGTVRHYLNALSGLYGRAQEGLYVAAGYNPVSALQEKPTGRWKQEARFFETSEAALILEAARLIEEGPRVNVTPGLHAIVATFLLTGGRFSEVVGLDVDDVSFDRDLIRFRPNTHRGLKTQTSHRTVPLWPQLRVILQDWLFGRDGAPPAGLLFPSARGGLILDMRKSLDAIGALVGLEPGEVRAQRFRHTYCSARLQTVQRILRPGSDAKTDREWDYVEVSKFQVQKEMGHGGAQLVNRVYGHAQRDPYRSEAVEYLLDHHRERLGTRLGEMMARSLAPAS